MMHFDVSDLQEFYATALGQAVRRLLAHRIRARWRGLSGATLIGLGYASPYLGAFRGEARRIGALMPEAQGALVWPKEAPTMSALAEEDRLPLADGSVDRLLAVHCLEVAERGRPLLREIWRVLSPEGRLMLIVPNRRGVWARLDNNPFGQGRPFSRRQLEALLIEAMFSPLDWTARCSCLRSTGACSCARHCLGAHGRGAVARVRRCHHRGGEQRARCAHRQARERCAPCAGSCRPVRARHRARSRRVSAKTVLKARGFHKTNRAQARGACA